MTAERYKKVKEIFLAVCDRPGPEQDEAAAGLCGDDTELMSEVQSLLHSHRSVRGAGEPIFLGQQAVSDSADSTTEADPVTISPQTPQPSVRHSFSPSVRESVGDIAYHSHTGTHGDTSLFPGKGRFESGTVVAERYRIVSLLGLGGMVRSIAPMTSRWTSRSR